MRWIFTLLLLLPTAIVCGQTVGDMRPDMIHAETLLGQQKPIPYPFVRESDIVWATMIWKTIDLNEEFNQYMYYPLDQEDISHKKSLAYVVWEGMERGEIPIFEDDELLVPIDNTVFIERYTRADTVLLEIGYDEDDNEIYQTVIVPKHFDGADIYQYDIRETWFINKQQTQQDSRRLALAPTQDVYLTLKSTGEDVYMGHAALFWIPMQHPSVRQVLARYTAFLDDNNQIRQPSWDYIFVHQFYTSYITRESNRYNRTVSSYVTGHDAILEAARIESKIHDIGEDMWEY